MIEKVCMLGLKQDPDYLYFIDRDGDVARARMIKEKKDAIPKLPNSKGHAKQKNKKE